MFTLRCTAKLLWRIKAPTRFEVLPPTTALGDWHANLYHTRPQHTVMCVNDKSLLVVLVPARDTATLHLRIRDAVVSLLRRLGVPPEIAEREGAQMEDVQYAPTNNRTVLGCLNDNAKIIDYLHEQGKQSTTEEHELFFARTPYSPLKQRYPREVAMDLLGFDAPQIQSLEYYHGFFPSLMQARASTATTRLVLEYIPDDIQHSFLTNRIWELSGRYGPPGLATPVEVHHVRFNAGTRFCDIKGLNLTASLPLGHSEEQARVFRFLMVLRGYAEEKK